MAGIVKAGSRNTDLVQNLDYAQTFLEIANAPQPKDMQGLSLVPLLKVKLQKLEKGNILPLLRVSQCPYDSEALWYSNKKYKLMHFYQFGNEWEMYDLKKDPDELTNLYGKKETINVQKSLTNRLKNLQKYYDDDSDVSIRPDYIELYRKES